MSTKTTTCKVCNQEIAKSAKSCPHCGARRKKPLFLRWWFWVIIIAIIAGAAGSGASAGNTTGNDSAGISVQDKENSTITAPTSIFEGDCGIQATAEIGDNIIGYPELNITITNITDKEIAAIKFYAVPYDVYGDEIKGWTTQKELYTDTAIPAGKTTTITYSLIENSVKSVKLYVYSVYFEDGTEWGDKNATSSKILDGAPMIEVFVEK